MKGMETKEVTPVVETVDAMAEAKAEAREGMRARVHNAEQANYAFVQQVPLLLLGGHDV